MAPFEMHLSDCAIQTTGFLELVQVALHRDPPVLSYFNSPHCMDLWKEANRKRSGSPLEMTFEVTIRLARALVFCRHSAPSPYYCFCRLPYWLEGRWLMVDG